MGVPRTNFVEDGYVTLIFCLAGPILGFVFSYVYYLHTARIELDPDKIADNENVGLKLNEDKLTDQTRRVWEVYNLIYDGAHSFLYAEYKYIAIFVVGFSVVLFVVLGTCDKWTDAGFTVIAFLVGCGTSVAAGFIGMKIGVFANARTAVQCQSSLSEGFVTSFKAAVVMGFVLCSMGVINLYILVMLFRLFYDDAMDYDGSFEDSDENDWGHHARVTQRLFEAIAGYGLGGSSIALFGRVGGGIYTKAADVGADLVGKVEAGIPEDDPRNPAVIADNVGDNVGDIAGMGSDLFGSFAESTCAAMVIAGQTGFVYNSHGYNSTVWQNWGWVSFPLVISASGIIVCFVTSFAATHIAPPTKLTDIEPTLKRQLLISTVLMTGALIGICLLCLPHEMEFAGDVDVEGDKDSVKVQNYELFFCAASGLWSGLIIGYLTEYYTSNQYRPVQDLSESCKTGAATNIILGLALGMKSDIVPCITLAVAVYISHSLAGFYGIALAALGILSTMSIGLTIDAFGPICDNAGGIAEMCELGESTRERTDALDAAGNTTAAIGKGFAIGSAAFVSLALFSGYITILQNKFEHSFNHVDILHAFPFCGLLVGAMLPYWFSAMTMAAVGRAAFQMVNEVRRQFREDAGILTGDSKPDYRGCIAISTQASLKEMVGPGALVMLSPLIVGFLFGTKPLAGLLIGALVSGVQMAISSSNTGGAWDNAKKYIEQGKLGPDHAKGSDAHKAAVVGDTVGDPLKDTSGPSLNILIKLMAVESLVFARAFAKVKKGLIPYFFDSL